MSDVRLWSQTPASNNSSPPDGWPEAQAPSTVNDCAREMMASLAEWMADTQTAVATGGTSTAYTATIAQDPASYAAPLGCYIKFHTTCGAAPTLNLNSLGAKSLYWPNGNALVSGDVVTNQYASIIYDGTNLIVYTSAGGAQAVTLDNRLINGEFRIWGRGTSLSAQADDTYGGMGDRWNILTQTSTIAGARQAAPFDGALNSGQLTQSQASAQRIGVEQIIENTNCQDLRSQTVTFYGRFKTSSGGNIRVAILEWTGTADAVTSDFVNSWTSSTYTAGNFFTTTTTTVTAVKQYASPGTGWVDFFINGTISSSATNVVVMLWTEGTEAQNVTIALANCGLVPGSSPPPKHTARSLELELALCQRYYTKTFALDTTPATNTGSYAGAYALCQTVGAAGGQRGFSQPYPVPMRAIPSVTTYNPGASNAQARNPEVPVDCSALNIGGASALHSERCITIQWTTGAGSAAGQYNAVHYSADAEL